MPKKYKIAAFVLLPIVALLLLTISIRCWVDHRVFDFSLDDYSGHVDAYREDHDRLYGTIETAEDARAVADRILQEEYRAKGYYAGTSKPLTVSFDEENQAWLVQATKHIFVKAGVHILLNKEDGRVLAIWMEKF